MRRILLDFASQNAEPTKGKQESVILKDLAHIQICTVAPEAYFQLHQRIGDGYRNVEFLPRKDQRLQHISISQLH